MSLFIETLRIADGDIERLPYHQARLERTRSHFWPASAPLSLEAALADRPLSAGVFKARVVYGENGVTEVSYAPYAVRHIGSLRLVTDDTIDYTYKSTDRSSLQALAAWKGDADEIIIVKEGLLTDTSYSNIALYDGNDWYTPRTPLLKGTMRQWLLEEGRIAEADIRPDDLPRYEKVALINAMMPLGTCVVQNILR